MCVCGDDNCDIPFGYCHCRCGEKTDFVKHTYSRRNFVKGNPWRFIAGHQRVVRPKLIDAVPFKIDGVYCRLISLTRGQYAIVDAIDYEWLMQWKWFAMYSKPANAFYAARTRVVSTGETKKRKHTFMHCEICEKHNGAIIEADHIDPINSLDNRSKNLRSANRSQNMQNIRTPKSNKSGYKGVYWHKSNNCWAACIFHDGKKLHLGSFNDPAVAHTAYCITAGKLFGEFARYS